jgi:hypothetical protein
MRRLGFGREVGNWCLRLRINPLCPHGWDETRRRCHAAKVWLPCCVTATDIRPRVILADAMACQSRFTQVDSETAPPFQDMISNPHGIVQGHGLVLGSTVGRSRRHGIRRGCRKTCDAKGRFRLFPMLPPLLGISVCACLAWELVSHQEPNRCQHLRLHMQQPPTEGHATMLQPRGTEGPRTKASSG